MAWRAAPPALAPRSRARGDRSRGVGPVRTAPRLPIFPPAPAFSIPRVVRTCRGWRGSGLHCLVPGLHRRYAGGAAAVSRPWSRNPVAARRTAASAPVGASLTPSPSPLGNVGGEGCWLWAPPPEKMSLASGHGPIAAARSLIGCSRSLFILPPSPGRPWPPWHCLPPPGGGGRTAGVGTCRPQGAQARWSSATRK